MRSLLVSLAALLLAAGARAAPASPESVESLLAATHSEQIMEAMYSNVENAMRQGMAQALKGQTLTPEQQRALDAMPAKFAAVMRSEVSWAKLKPGIVQIYVDTFDQSEIDGLAAFYRSPTGQAFVNKMPVVMQKSMEMTQAMMASFVPKMKAAMDSAIADAKKAP